MVGHRVFKLHLPIFGIDLPISIDILLLEFSSTFDGPGVVNRFIGPLAMVHCSISG